MSPETVRFPIGSFSCVAIRDNLVEYPIGMFLTNVPTEEYQTRLRQRGEDPERLELPYTCLVIDTGSDRVLVDTGAGGAAETPGRLIPLLRAEGIDPAEIGTVILSHGHGDHVGGNLDDQGKPAFPNARYVVCRREWEFWMSNPTLDEWSFDETMKKATIAFVQRNLSGIAGQVDLVEPDVEIAPGIRAFAAFGHSPGQIGLEIASRGEQMLFMADAVVHPLHLEFPEAIGMTDHHPPEVRPTRIALLERAARERALVATSHFQFPGLGYVVANGDRWEWQPFALVATSTVFDSY